jgi:hypothetical protein
MYATDATPDPGLRDRVTLPTGLSTDTVAKRAVATERVSRSLDGRPIRNVVHVPTCPAGW